MQTLKKLVMILACLLFLASCATTKTDTYVRTYDVSHPDKTIEHYIEIIQTYSPSLLREVLHFEGRREREYLISEIHREILPLVTSPYIEEFREMTQNPVQISVIDSIAVSDTFHLYLVHYNKPNLLYGIQPDVLEFLRVKKYGQNWLIEIAFKIEEINKERELKEEDPIMGALEFELWRLERRRRNLRRKSDREIALEKTKAEAKYDLLRRNREEWGNIPNFSQVYNYWRHMTGVYAGMSPSDLRNYLLTETERQIESTRNLLRR